MRSRRRRLRSTLILAVGAAMTCLVLVLALLVSPSRLAMGTVPQDARGRIGAPDDGRAQPIARPAGARRLAR